MSPVAQGGSRDRAFEAVHARLLRFLPDLVLELGGSPRRLADELGIATAVAMGRVAPTYREVVLLIGHAADVLGCSDFGMRLAKRQGGAMFGPLGEVMRSSRTFGEALEYVGSHNYAHSLAARIWRSSSPDDETIFSGHDILLEGIPDKRQAIEQILLAGSLTAMEMTGGRVRARRVHFRHQPMSPQNTYRAYFGCSVRFGQNEDGVFYNKDDLVAPIIAADPEACETATRYIEAEFQGGFQPIHAQVRGHLMQRFPFDPLDSEDVAKLLMMHPRTLHRKLVEEGSSFQKVKNQVRRDYLIYYLQHTDLDLTVVSERLAFSEQSVLSRTCKRWFGISPRDLRAKLRKGGGHDLYGLNPISEA